MLRKFTGGATLLLGMAVLLTGFYAPAHSTIYFQYGSIWIARSYENG